MPFDDPITEQLFKPGWRDGPTGPAPQPDMQDSGFSPFPEGDVFKPTPRSGDISAAQSLKGSGLAQPVQPAPTPGPTDWGGVAKDIGTVFTDLPTQFKGGLAAQFQPSADIGTPGTLTDWAKSARSLAKQRQQEPGGEQVVIPGINVTRQDIRDLPTSLGFSGVAQLTGLSAGLGSALIPGVNRLAKPIGLAASGMSSYKQAKHQLLSDVLDAASQGARRPLSEDERTHLLNRFDSSATEHGLWEAIPAVAGEAFGLHAITKPLKKTLTKAFGETVGLDVLGRLAKMYGVEIGTEAITLHGQHNVGVRAGLESGPERSFLSPSDLVQSTVEVAPPTFLQATVMGGLGLAGRRAIDLMHSERAQKTIQDELGAVARPGDNVQQTDTGRAPWPDFQPPYEVQKRQPGVLPAPPPYSTAPKQPLPERPPLPFIGMSPIPEDHADQPDLNIEGAGYNGLPFVDLPFQSARGLETDNTPNLGIQDLSEPPAPPPFAFGGENWNRFPGKQAALSPESVARKPVAEPSTTPVVTQEAQPFGTKPGVESETKPRANLSEGQTNAKQVTSPETAPVESYEQAKERWRGQFMDELKQKNFTIPGESLQERTGQYLDQVRNWFSGVADITGFDAESGKFTYKGTPSFLTEEAKTERKAAYDAVMAQHGDAFKRMSLDLSAGYKALYEAHNSKEFAATQDRARADQEERARMQKEQAEQQEKAAREQVTEPDPRALELTALDEKIRSNMAEIRQQARARRESGETEEAIRAELQPQLEEGKQHLDWLREHGFDRFHNGREVSSTFIGGEYGSIPKEITDYANRKPAPSAPTAIPGAASQPAATQPTAQSDEDLTPYALLSKHLADAGYKVAAQAPKSPAGEARLRKRGYQSYVYDQSGNLVDHPDGLGVWAMPPVDTTQKQKTSPTQEDSIYGKETNVTSQSGQDAGTNYAHGAVQNASETSGAQPDQESLLILTSQTEQDIIDQEAKLKRAQEEESASEKAVEAKRKADAEVGDFVLTGSDHPVDQAEARGQKGLFDGPETEQTTKPQKQQEPASVKPEVTQREGGVTAEQHPSAIIKPRETANSQEQPSAARRQRRTTRKTEESTNVTEPKTTGEADRISPDEPRAETVSRAETEREAGTARRESSRGNAGRTGTGNEPSSNRSGQELAVASISSESPEVNRGPTANLERNIQDVPRVPARNRGDDYRIQPGELNREGSWLAAANGNVDAVELVSLLEKEKRQPTKEEQAKLLKFVGWGPGEIRNNLFPPHAGIGGNYSPVRLGGEWRKLGERVEQVFTDEDWRTVARSTQYAHYTAEPVVRSIYRGLEQLGFTGGSVIEPGAGIGLFAGLMPDGIYRNSSYVGIEMDGFSAKIAQLLNPNQTVKAQDYTKAKIPTNFFDLAIGNPPFADIKVLSDPAYRKHGFLLHDYFFAKTLDSVRPGGLLVFITSNGTMDKKSTEARDYLIERADLIGAIRLPKTAFQQNAGTEVVTDIIFLRKRSPGEVNSGANWRSSIAEVVDGVPQSINEYFVAHPDMVLGTHSSSGTMYRANSYIVLPKQGDFQQQLNDAMDRLPKNIYSVIKPQVRPEVTQSATIEKDFNPIYQKEGGIYLTKEGGLMRVEQGVGIPIGTVERLQGGDYAFLSDYVGLRDALKQAHHDQLVDGDWKTSLQALNDAYDGFVGKHGPIKAFSLVERKEVDADGNPTTREERRYKNYRVLRMDAEYTRVLALEDILDDGSIVKGKGLLDRVLNRPMVPKIETASDAVAVSLSTIGRFDIDHAANIFGVSQDEMARILGDLVFQSPNGQYQLADEYLSGNVKNKLDEARIAAAADQKYQRNVDALEKVQPPVLGAADVTVQLGAAWIPAADVADFARDVLKINNPDISYSKTLGSWTVLSGEGPRVSRSGAAEWGTADRSPVEILDSVLNKSQIRIYRTEGDGKDKRTVFDQAATVAVNDLAKRMADEFQEWAFRDGRRAQRLLDLYNENFNLFSPRNFDGKHINPTGMSLLYSLHDHQKRTIWRQIASGNTYLAHAVGAGKSLEMIIGGMEQKRLGLIRKPMYVVPNHMLTQFASEFMEAYPAANIMVADSDSFHTDKRRGFVAQAALNDPDAIILSHSAFGLLKLKPENMAAAIKETLDQLREQLEEEIGDNSPSSRRSRSQIEKRIERLEQQISSKTREEKKDNALHFEDLGVDYLYVDEAHEFRKLDLVTNMKVKGLDPQGSQRALDLYAKTKWLNKQRPGRSFSFASGTPITNTMAEMYTIQRFFQEDLMKEEGIHHFDAWAAMFGKVAKFYERNATGELEVVERFGKFVNVYDMMSRALEFMDTLTSKQLAERFAEMKLAGKPVLYPEVRPGNAGRRNLVSVQKSSQLDEYLTGPLADRLKESREWKPSKDEPNNPDPVINIITDGRLASIDYRFINPNLRDDPGSKLNRMIDEIARIYKETAKNAYIDQKTQKPSAIKGAAQIVFASAGFGDAVIANRGFDSRAWVMRRLKEKGIKPSEVAWIWDYKTPERKQSLFKAVRDGQVRVMIGSPKNMGTGVNAQQRLIALHHLDAPWYPSDLEQPEGRIVRQGNQNKEVEIYGYATDGTYDSTMWSMVARKSGFIEQAFRGDRRMRTMDDIGEASQYSMAAAIASGDQRYIRLAELEDDVSRLEMARKAHDSRQHSIASEIRSKEYDVSRQKERLTFSRQVDEAIKGQSFYSGSLVGTVDGNDLSRAKSGEIGKFLMDAWRDALSSLRTEAINKATETKAIVHAKIDRDIGAINGLTLHLTGDVAAQTNTDGSVAIRKDKSSRLVLSAMVNQRKVFDLWDDFTLPNSYDEAGAKFTDHGRKLYYWSSEISSTINALKDEVNELKARLGAPFAHEQEYLERLVDLQALRDELLQSGKQVDTLALGAAENTDVLMDEQSAISAADMDWEGGGQAARFSLREAKGNSLSVQMVEQKIAGIPLLKMIPAQARVVANETELPRAVQREISKQKAEGKVSAVFHGGAIYLVASNLKTAGEVEEAVLHEIAHLGVRKLYGPGAIQTLRAIYNAVGGDAGIRELAKSHGFDMEAYFRAAEEAYANDPLGRRVLLADELLAHLNQHGPKSLPAKVIMAIRQFIGAVKAWMRQNGLAEFAKWSDSDLAHELRRIMDAAKGMRTQEASASLFLFAGKRSSTGDKEALDAARKFSLAGHNEEKVRQATGWHQGADGQWRFEIDDSQASLRLKPQETALLENGSSVAKALGGLVNHKDLFAAYPQLYGVWVKIIPGMEGGSFDARNKAIEIGWDGADRTLNGLLHEIQHSIQSVEGFARGGNFRTIMDHAFTTSGDIDKLSEAVANELGSDDIKSLLAKADEARQNNNIDSAKKYQAQASYLAAYRVYYRLAGEVEARNVQARQDLTADERRNISPEFTADIPLEQQVVLFRNRLMSEGLLPGIEGMKEEMTAPPIDKDTRQESGDIRFSLRLETAKNDAEYLEAVKAGDPLSKRFNYRSYDTRFHLKPDGQETYHADMEAQVAVMTDEAVRAGYKTIDDWAQAKPERFLAMAAQWRDDHPMRFSMAAEGTKQPGAIGGLTDRVRDTLSDWLTYPGSKTRPGWWDKTVGTMRDLAKKSPEFKRVLDILERSNWDSTRLASQAEKLATLWFRDLSSGIRVALTTGTLNTADQKAVSEALWAITTGEKKRYDINTEYGKKALARHGLTTEQNLNAYDQAMKAVELVTDQSAKSFAVRMGQAHHLDQGMLLSLFDDSRNIAELRQNMDDWVRGGVASPDVIGEDTKGNQVYSIHWLKENKAIVEKAMQQMRKEKAVEKELQPYQEKLDAINKMLKGHETLLEELQKLQAKVWKLGQEGYFPLMRFGRYVVAAVDENGKHQPDLPFLMFETKHEANRAAREMRRQGLTIRQETMNPDQWKMFEGISPEAVSAFAEFLPEEMQEIFQQWVKHAVSDSSALNRLLHRKEVPGWSRDAQRVLAQYLVSSARLASRNLHGMSLDRAVRDIKQGDTQQQAQKLVEYLRNPEEEYPGIRSFLFFWYLGGSISSAITNITQPVLTTVPFLSKYGLSAPAIVAKWMAKAPTGIVPDRFKSDMQRAIDEGLVSPQEIHNLMATARGGPLSGSRIIRSRPVQIGLLGWGSLFSLAEQFNRRVTFLSALEMADANPKIVKEAGFKDRYEFAKNAVEETQFVYARWNRPAWARGKAAILFTFKQFTIQYLEFIKSLPMPQRVLALSLLAMAAGMAGLPGEEDVEDILDTIGQWLGYPTNSRAWLMNHVPGVILNGLQDLGLPFDIQAKLSLGNVIPGTGALIPSKPDRARDVADIFGAAGNLVSNLAQATASATKGDVTGALSMMAPRAVSAFLKGIDMASSGIATDQAGRKITDVTGLEAAMKLANFTPRSVSKIQQASKVNLEIKNYFQMREDHIVDQLARARVDGDEALAAKARREWEQWNADHPDTPIRITGAQIQERVRALVTNKQARVIKSIPREIRGEGRRIFEEATEG